MNEEMMKAMAGKQMPEMAIVESNTLAAMGLRQLLESVMPMMKSRPSVRSVSTRQTILTTLFIVCIYAHCTGTPLLLHTGQQEPPRDRSNTQQRSQFATCRISLSLRQCTRRIPDKRVSQPAAFRSSSWRTYPCHAPCHSGKVLSDREIEVLSLVAQGKINKEIADQLCIGLTTVITHRKKIQENWD